MARSSGAIETAYKHTQLRGLAMKPHQVREEQAKAGFLDKKSIASWSRAWNEHSYPPGTRVPRTRVLLDARAADSEADPPDLADEVARRHHAAIINVVARTEPGVRIHAL